MQSGSKLGHYTILSALGKGGMGEVWRARDTKLGREVAIKTLLEEFAKDADRLARFEREAKLLASLNHPNIAAIYGLEESNADAPKLLFEGVFYTNSFDITPDGERFLMITMDSRGDTDEPAKLVVVQNWFEELRRLVPVN